MQKFYQKQGSTPLLERNVKPGRQRSLFGFTNPQQRLWARAIGMNVWFKGVSQTTASCSALVELYGATGYAAAFTKTNACLGQGNPNYLF